MSTTLTNKIDFEAIITVTNANPNGDPLGGNRPRTDYDGFGEISDVCIKRKIRNRMQDIGHPIFVQSDDRCDDGEASLKDRAKDNGLEKLKTRTSFSRPPVRPGWMSERSGRYLLSRALRVLPSACAVPFQFISQRVRTPSIFSQCR